MSADSQRELVAEFYENFNRSNLDAALAAFSTDLETIDPGMGTVFGHEPFREYLEVFKRAMPDAHAVIESLNQAGDTVIVEGRFVGTHTGPLVSPDGDVEPTGASVDLRFADFSRVHDGSCLLSHLLRSARPADPTWSYGRAQRVAIQSRMPLFACVSRRAHAAA
jgi:ketosteroid isomerase-like protein